MGNVQSGAALDPYTAIGGCTASSALIAVATVIVNALSPTPHHYNCNVHGQLNPSKASAAAVTTITSASCANTNAPVYFAPNKGIDYCRDQCFAAGPTGQYPKLYRIQNADISQAAFPSSTMQTRIHASSSMCRFRGWA